MTNAKRLRSAAEARIAELLLEKEESARLRESMADLLTRTANALKGKPKPLCQHSWHDLPEVAGKLRERLGDIT